MFYISAIIAGIGVGACVTLLVMVVVIYAIFRKFSR